MLNRITFAALLAAAAFAPAHAGLSIDTGAANGGPPLAVDGTDWLAGRVDFDHAQTVTGIAAWLNDQGSAGVFSVSLYEDTGFLGLPSPSALYSAKAAYTTAAGEYGWNGAAGLNWSVAAGSYWVAIEVLTDPDTLMTDSFVGLAGTAPPLPLAAYAFNAGSGYSTAGAVAFGVQVSSVPEPATAALWLLGGLGLAAFGIRRRRDA